MRNFYIGVDLGKQNDHTTVAIVEKQSDSDTLSVCHLERLPLGTTYTTVVQQALYRLRATMAHGTTTLVVDASGLGLPVIDLLKASGTQPVAITITGGNSVAEGNGVLRVPKRDLIINLARLFESGRLRIASDLPRAGDLIQELLGFQVRINRRTKRESYQAGKTNLHDDLVLAVALACWCAERKDQS
jgi:hypothetical protein